MAEEVAREQEASPGLRAVELGNSGPPVGPNAPNLSPLICQMLVRLDAKIFKKNGIKIGVLGVGIELEGLVEKKLFSSIKYNNPLDCANNTAHHLKNNLQCDYVICLSHLGYKYDSKKVSDIILAEQSKNIDLVIGGHTHTFLNEPVKHTNSEGKEVLITQVGWAGIWLGKIEIFFSNTNKKVFHNSDNQKI